MPAGSRSLTFVLVVVAVLFALLPMATATLAPGDGVPSTEAPADTDDPTPAFGVYPMIFPIIGDVNYTDTFGACRSGCTRKHKGIDLMAAKMTPVVAVADGTVGWMHDEQGGNCCAMALNHDDGWESWYIHLNNDTPGTDDGIGWGFAEGIVPGARVRAGQHIGWVGDSGNAENTAPHVHFELHRPDETIANPYDSLQAATVLAAPLAEIDARGCDFDGDGYDDLVVGTPGEDFGAGGSKSDAGAVTVLYGAASGVGAQTVEQITNKTPGVKGGLMTDARFGSATACGDFDGDGYDDLGVGAPGRTVKDVVGTGAVTVLNGGPGGLYGDGTNNMWHLARPGVKEIPAEGAGFGSVLAVGDFNDDGFDDLAVGAPDKVRLGREDAGIVVVLLGSSGGIDGTSVLLVDGFGDLSGRPEQGDGFGTALAADDIDGDGNDDVVIGIPGQVRPGVTGSGEVVVVAGAPGTVFDLGRSQRLLAGKSGWVSTAGARFGASLATGDIDGDGGVDLIVGAPGDDADGANAGSIRYFPGGGTKFVSGSSSVEVTQATPGIPGQAAGGAGFGAGLVADDFDADGRIDVAVAAPFATVAGQASAGAVVVIHGSGGGLDSGRTTLLDLDSVQAWSSPAVGDQLGQFLSTGDYTGAGAASLVIGAPGKQVGLHPDAGVVYVVPAVLGGLDLADIAALRENMSELPGKSETGDGFGVLRQPSA